MPGAYAPAACGATAAGVAPIPLRRWTADQAAAAGLSRSGACTTTLVALILGQQADVEVAHTAQKIVQFVAVLRQHPERERVVRGVWHGLLLRIAPVKNRG